MQWRLTHNIWLYIWWLQHLHRWLPSQVTYSASNSPSCVLRWLWRLAADLQGWWQTWHTKVKVLTGLIGSAWEILSLCTTICLFSPDADLHTLLHITHTVLSGHCRTGWRWSVNVRLHMVHIPWLRKKNMSSRFMDPICMVTWQIL